MRFGRVICASLCALLLGVAVAGAEVYPGDYAAKGKGVSAQLDVGASGGAKLAYAMKSACGRSKGTLELSKAGGGLGGRRVSRGPHGTLRTTTAKVALSGDGSEVVGTIRESLEGGDSELDGCRAKRSFSADADQAEGFVPSHDGGHYAGNGPNDNPIDFDVVSDGKEAQVENLSVDVTADCVSADDPEAPETQMVTHISGMSGRVAKDGTFYIDYAPDDDTEYAFDGTIGDGESDVDVIIGGYFDDAGNPDPAGSWACDSWGDLYSASRG